MTAERLFFGIHTQVTFPPDFHVHILKMKEISKHIKYNPSGKKVSKQVNKSSRNEVTKLIK